MSLGTISRRVLGPLFPFAAAAYRRVFVDIRKVAEAVPVLSPGALLVDVGGGDGALLNPLLDRQAGLRVVMVDIASTVGISVRADLRSRVEMRPMTSLRDYLDSGGERPAAVLLADVLHHVDPTDRADLVKEILEAFGDREPLIVVKDVEPRGLRAWAAFAADRYVSGDRNVSRSAARRLLP